MFSQAGEDGVIDGIFKKIGTTNKFYVEIGVETGEECNTRVLREWGGWDGIMIDGEYGNPGTNMIKEYAYEETIAKRLIELNVPIEADLMSMDIDSQDWYVVRGIMEGGFRPRVWITEINCPYPIEADYVQERNYSKGWYGNQYFGATLGAFNLLLGKFGYSLVHVTIQGINAFWVRNDVLE